MKQEHCSRERTKVRHLAYGRCVVERKKKPSNQFGGIFTAVRMHVNKCFVRDLRYKRCIFYETPEHRFSSADVAVDKILLHDDIESQREVRVLLAQEIPITDTPQVSYSTQKINAYATHNPIV